MREATIAKTNEYRAPSPKSSTLTAVFGNALQSNLNALT